MSMEATPAPSGPDPAEIEEPTPSEGPPGQYAEIAVPVPLRRTFTYRIPDELRGAVRPGAVVTVPFGRRKITGFVVGLVETPPAVELKDILTAETDDLSLPPELMRLAEWVADYYLAPFGEVLRTALPAGLGKRSPGEVPEAAGTPSPVTLNEEQTCALAAIEASLQGEDPASFLLHGVTGSGKTEVYLRAATSAVQAGGKVLILIPEIALSPQMVARVEARFGNRVALWHSALTPSRRRAVWTRTRRGEIDVLVGARSAVFAPLPGLKLVVVDEEHESAYKQSESPRYHARDVALVRARQCGATVVLGSATPSLESYANAERGKYRLLELPQRVHRRPMDRVEIVPLPYPEKGKPKPVSLIFSDRLRSELAEVLSRGEQSILFLNRRGHSTVVQCTDCREVVKCGNCDIVLTYHVVGDRLRCHYCGASRPRPDVCGACAGVVGVYKGVGTQKVQAELRRLYAGARVLRLDTDTARKRGTVEETLETFRRGDADVLLGTQMVAKGLDFPRVTLVGVVNADTQLALPDFRSAERTFQLLTQVAGRSGRGEHRGRIVFQTGHPDHPALTCAAAQDFPRFYRTEIPHRRELGYPPFNRLVNLLFDGKDEAAVIREAETAATRLARRSRDRKLDVELLGPAPQPISRLKGQYRWHITLRGPSARDLHRLAEDALKFAEESAGRVRLAVDVDPASML